MPAEVQFDESEVEPIVGTAPSAYDQVVVFDESEVEPIVGRPSPYQGTVVFDESEVEPIIGAAPSGYNGTTASEGRGDAPGVSAYEETITFPDALAEVFYAPAPESPYAGTTAAPDSATGQPGGRRAPSPYDGVVVFDEADVEPIVGRRPRAYDLVVAPPAPPSVPPAAPPLLGRGPLRRGVISWELMDAWDLPRPTTRLAGVSEAQLQVLSWLEAHRDTIVDVERRRHVDRRAIAAAIAWEALENTAWPFSRRAVGVGKVHTKSDVVRQVEGAGYLPARSDAAREALLRDPAQAIEYIGAIMQAQSEIAAKAGYDIRRRVDILTNEYNGRDLEAWRRQLAAKKPGAPLVPGNDMALWARDNTWYVELGVGSPDPAAFP